MTRIVHQAHDKLFKESMADIRVATEFFTSHLSERLLKNLDLTSLRLEKHSFIDEAYKSFEADVVYSVNCCKQHAYLYLLCENQSWVDQRMAFRLLNYTLRIMELHSKKYPKDKELPIVYPLVIYSGEKIWHAPTDIYELFGKNRQLAQEILFKPFELIDLHRIEDDQLRKYIWSGLVEFAMKYQKVKDFARFLEFLLPWLNELEQQQGESYGRIVLDFVSNNLQSDNTELFIDKIQTYLTGTLRGEAMTLAQAFERKGLQQGLQQGMQREKQNMAARLLAKGFSLEDVAGLTGLSVKVIKVLEYDTVH